MVEWFSNYWWLVSIGIGVLIAAINGATEHYSTMPDGLRKTLSFIGELLSVVVSAGAKVGSGPMSRLKLPGQNVPPVDAFKNKEAAQ